VKISRSDGTRVQSVSKYTTVSPIKAKPMAKNRPIRCPVCNEVMKSPQGLHGHLRFKHDIWDDELDRIFEQAQRNHMVSEAELEESRNGSTQDDDTSDSTGPQPSSTGGQKSLETMLARIEELREELSQYDRSQTFLGLFTVRRDEGPKEALQALDEMEMVVRERLGTGETDDDLRRKVVNTLDKMEGLVKCRRQRDAIEQKFSGGRAEQRVEKLDRREASIRKHVRQEWGVGTPLEDLPERDPVAAK